MKLPGDATIAPEKLLKYLLQERSVDDKMKYELFQRVALARDFPESRLKKGDVATVVDCHPDPNGEEPGYSIEIFNALGETIQVLVVSESDLQPLRADEVLKVRALEEVESSE